MQVFTIRTIVTGWFAAALIGSTGTVATAQLPASRKQCHTIKTTQTVVADFATFTTAGVIKSGLLKGTTAFIGDPLSLTPLSSTVTPPLQPTSAFTGNLRITTSKGTLTTRSTGLFETVPFGRGTQSDRVIAGTGEFSGAEGFLFFNFEADETGAAFTSVVTGEVCVR